MCIFIICRIEFELPVFVRIESNSLVDAASEMELCSKGYFREFCTRTAREPKGGECNPSLQSRDIVPSRFRMGELRMFGRSLFGAVEAFRSRVIQAWATGWSVPTDEVFIQVRLLRRHIEATGGIAEWWLLKAARSAAVKWRDEVCRTHSGQVRSVTLAGPVLPPVLPARVAGVLHVTARYCGRTHGGGFRFRHSLCDRRGVEVQHFISQVYFDFPPELPVYPAIQLNAGELLEKDFYENEECIIINLAPKSISIADDPMIFTNSTDKIADFPQVL